jgi:hypothetical protein
MKKHFLVHSILIVFLSFPFHASAENQNEQDIQTKLMDLQNHIEQLESRVKQLEQGIVASGGEIAVQPKGPWEKLTMGMTYQEVTEILGKPMSRKKGGVEYWFYSAQKLDGPYVKFLFEKVDSWKTP